ncbi:MAG: hypothetical protein H7Y20_00975 [Bryobacteraceae bacterium]|nr:hypothetical protein [Bryobacteraceae bacterium]
MVQASSFTIVTPDYLQEGPFTTGPFELTFAGNSVPITQAYLSAFYGNFCFTFGSDEATLGLCAPDPGSTGAAFGGQFNRWDLPPPDVGGPPPSSYWLPNAPGQFIAGAPIVEYGSARAVFNLNLTVKETSAIPEPATLSLTLMAVIIAAVVHGRCRSGVRNTPEPVPLRNPAGAG